MWDEGEEAESSESMCFAMYNVETNTLTTT